MASEQVFKRLIFFLLLLFSVSFSMGEKTCTGGKELIFFDFDNSVKELLPASFTETFPKQLKSHLLDIGYCLANLNAAVASDSGKKNTLIMLFSIKVQTGFPDTLFTMQIDLVKTNETGEGQQSQSNSFLSVTFGSEEFSTMETVLIRKIIENLRMHYVCHLRIHSSPQGVLLKTDEGLEGVTPLEWIVPVGILTINGELKGYEMIQSTIDISEPGVHTYFLQLRRRQFYHSKMMIPSAVLMLTSAVCFFSERYYLNNYHNLEKNDLEKNPELSENTYNRAKNFGRVGTATLILSCISLVLTFKF